MKKNKSVEEYIYEALGIVYFKKFVIWLQHKIRIPNKKMGMLNRGNYSMNGFDNYFLNDYSIEGLKKFKREGIFFNSIIHGPLLIKELIQMGFAINAGQPALGIIGNLGLPILLNAYCIMLQRYNTIRINRTIKLLEKKEQIKKAKDEKEKYSDMQRIMQRRYELYRYKNERKRVETLEKQRKHEDYRIMSKDNNEIYISDFFDKDNTTLQRIRK